MHSKLGFICCVEELVFHLIEENSTCIAVRVDWDKLSLQVVGNGNGLAKPQLQILNTRVSDKIEDYINKTDAHLEKAICFSATNFHSVLVESQAKNSNVSYKRQCQNKMWSNIDCVGTRSTSGTTVTLEGFLSIETEDIVYFKSGLMTSEIEKLIASIYLLHSNRSFSLRANPFLPPCLQTKKMKNTVHAAQELFQVEKIENILPFRGLSKHFKVKGLIVTQLAREFSWFIYANSRLVESPEITRLLTSVLFEMNTSGRRLNVILNIKCSQSVCEYKIGSDGKRGAAFSYNNELQLLIQNSLDRFITHAPFKKSSFVSRWLTAAYGDNLIHSSNNVCSKDAKGADDLLQQQQPEFDLNQLDKSLIENPTKSNTFMDISQHSSPLQFTANSDTSHQFFYGRIENSIPIAFHGNQTENSEIRMKNSPNAAQNSSTLLNPQELFNLWTEEQQNLNGLSTENGKLSTCAGEMTEETEKCEEKMEMDSSTRLSCKRRYIGANDDTIGLRSTKEIKTWDNLQKRNIVNKCWVQPRLPPNIAVSNFSGLMTTALQRQCKFTRSAMEDMHVLNQVDRKFICCISSQEEEKRYLLLIDQHAAHERVCLERLMNMHSSKDDDNYIVVQSSPLHPHLKLFFPFRDLQIIQKLSSDFMRYGLHLQFSDSTVLVTRVPSCFLAREINEIQRKRSSLYKELVVALIEETIAEYTKNGRLGTCLLPLQIRDVLNSLACRGAIKFGDELSLTQCVQLVKSLGQCEVPFQCAHGRPLLAPLLELSELIPLAMNPVPKPNYGRLSSYDFA